MFKLFEFKFQYELLRDPTHINEEFFGRVEIRHLLIKHHFSHFDVKTVKGNSAWLQPRFVGWASELDIDDPLYVLVSQVSGA